MSLEDEAKAKFLEDINELAAERGETNDKAFTAWIAKNTYGIEDDSIIDEAIAIGAPGDYGIDFFHIDESGEPEDHSINWCQAKFSENCDHVISKEELETWVNTIEYLETCPSDANDFFKRKSQEFKQCGGVDATHHKIRMKLIFTGTLGTHAKTLLNDPVWRGSHIDPKIEFEIVDRDKILGQVAIAGTLPVSLSFQDCFCQVPDPQTGKQSIQGRVKAANIIKIYRENKDRLFLENPREALGKTPANKAMIATLKDSEKKKKFWKLNNGITAICSGLEPSETNANQFTFTNFKVVNGRQTTYTLDLNRGDVDDSVLVTLTVHDTDSEAERNAISESTNTQNPITPDDLVSNYPEIVKLVLNFKRNYPEFYFERQRKGFNKEPRPKRTLITTRRVVRKEPIARQFLAFRGDPFNAIGLSKRSLFLDTVNFKRVFENREAKELIIPHILYDVIEILKKRYKNDPNKKIEFTYLNQRILVFYMLGFIKDSLDQCTDDEIEKITNKIIELVKILRKEDPYPQILMELAENAYLQFIDTFHNVTRDPQTFAEMEYEAARKILLKTQTLFNTLKGSKRNQENLSTLYPIKDKLLEIITT